MHHQRMNLVAFLAALLLTPAVLAATPLRGTAWFGEVERKFELKIGDEKLEVKTMGSSDCRFGVRSFRARGEDGMLRGTYYESGREAQLVLRNGAVAKLKRAAFKSARALLRERDGRIPRRLRIELVSHRGKVKLEHEGSVLHAEFEIRFILTGRGGFFAEGKLKTKGHLAPL